MGILTTDMTRLCGEISALRGARAALKQDLEYGAKNLKETVSAMKADFHHAQTVMARKMKAERTAFVSSLQKAVSRVRKDFSADLVGAHRAWFGKKRG